MATTTDPTAKVAALRAALATRLVTTGVTVLAWPADTQMLPVPCWTIGVPEHDVIGPGPAGGTVEPVAGADWQIGSWGWSMAWPLRLYTPMLNDATSMTVIDAQVGQLIAAVRSDRTLGGECIDAAVRGVEHELNDEDPTGGVRLHIVTAVVVTVSSMPDA